LLSPSIRIDSLTNVVIGVDPATSSTSGAVGQRNVFALPSNNNAVLIFDGSGVITGNSFGYTINGGTLTTAPASTVAIYMKSTSWVIGTDGNNSGDDVESNWFGCVTQYGIYVAGSGPVTVAGNYFGFAVVGQTTPGVAQPAICSASNNLVYGSRLTIGI